jgi:ketosteroid isomerase-like protein
MSEENVEIVKAMNAAYAQGDVERALATLHPEVEWRGTLGGVDERAVYHGREEVVGAFVDNLSTWESLSLDYEDYIDAGDKVVVFVHEVARGRESGAETETDTAMVFEFEGDQVIRARAYMDRSKALEAAGLSE